MAETEEVTVTIPKDLYSRVERLALLREQSLPEIMADLVNVAYSEEFEQAAIPAPVTSIEDKLMQEEEDAFDQMRAQLLEKFEGQYVAVHGGQVIDHDTSQNNLLIRLHRSHPDRIVLVRQVMALPDDPIYWRTLRLHKAQ
jgi:predicted transcriptional regulator